SGTVSAWIKIEGDASGGTVVIGAGVNQNILVSANFLIIQKLTLAASDANGIVLSSGQHHIFVQDNTLQNVSFLCAQGPTTTHYGDAGILVKDGTTNVY